MRSGRKCFLCHNTRYRSKNCRLFRFPARGTTMWTGWLKAMALVEEDIRPDEHPRLCQRHFDRKDFLTRQLSGMAVPVRNLKRICDVKIPIDEEYLEQDGGVLEETEQEAEDVKDTAGVEILEENVLEYEGIEDELLDGENLQQNSSPFESKFIEISCNIPQHEEFNDLLHLERDRVKKLIKINTHQKSIIEEQRKLLLQLGVECVVQEQDVSSDDSE